jgi:hypothetical protein
LVQAKKKEKKGKGQMISMRKERKKEDVRT